MSINVHVTGNPISIKKGKMVTADLDHCRQEFDKRRLMRLEQVRQQSKDIAEGLRNKVKKEKKLQMKDIEEDGKQKLKNWQNRKLLELQTQYKQALKEVGVAHKAAQAVGNENEILAEQERINQERAAKRGKIAETKQNEDKLKAELKKALAEQRRQETRAQVLSNGPKYKKPKAKKRRHGSSSDSDEESVTDSSDLSDIEESVETEESSSCSCGVEVSNVTNVSKQNGSAGDKYADEQSPIIVPPLRLESDESPIRYPITKAPPTSTNQLASSTSLKKKFLPTYTKRISEKIKHRDLPSDTDHVRCSEPPPISKKSTRVPPVPVIRSRSDIQDFIDSRNCHADCVCCCARRAEREPSPTKFNNQHLEKEPEFKDKAVNVISKQDQAVQSSATKLDVITQIPSQPSVRLKSTTKESISSKKQESSKVHVYDHPNRFSYEKSIPVGSFVERIPAESLEYFTDPASEEERQEAIKRRDRDAQIRGKKALEREKLQREYEEMLKKLPLLQKKERICEIFNDKPEYHMSEDRLKEKERERQNNLENVYNKLYPNLKPAVVTLPKVREPQKDESSDAPSVHSLNVAEWDVDYKAPYKFSSQEVQDIIKEFIKHHPRDRRSKLKELLKKLNIQRGDLLKALEELPKNDSIDELINDLKSFRESDVKAKGKSAKSSTRKRSRRENEADTSVDSSQETSSKENLRDEREVSRRTGKSPRKKAKTKTKPTVIILQNTSTQTTPKPEKPEEKKSVKSSEKISEQKICKKLHIPCDCNKENQDVTDDLCHIFIKLNENDNPEVLVKSKDKERISKPVLTKHTTVGTQISPKEPKKSSSRHKQYKPKATQVPSDTTVEKSRTWKDQFSKNSVSTTSTSYLSPPDFIKPKNSDKGSFYNLRTKPQQRELSSAFSSTRSPDFLADQLPYTLKPYVNQLLGMSKGIVDDLSITTSNIETPTQSIIETDTNVVNEELRHLIETVQHRIQTIAESVSQSTRISPVPFNTSASISSGVSHHSERSPRVGNEKLTSTSNEDLVAQYAQISESVTKRIQTLAEMIEHLREEKVKMLQVSTGKTSKGGPDKDYSTSYMDLPESKSGSTNTSSSWENEEILRKLMEIDPGVVNKIGASRNSTKDEVDKTRSSSGSKHRNLSSPNSTNQEIIQRLQRLKSDKDAPKPEQQSFIPFLSDIPQLPKFEPVIDTGQMHKRPPPSKGLNSAKKFNGNITLVPHELSTIVEADSQISTKLPSPETSDMNLNPPLLSIPEVQEKVSMESHSSRSTKSPRVSPTSKETSKSSGSSKYKTTSDKDDSTKVSSEETPSLMFSLSGSSKSENSGKTKSDKSGAVSLQQFSSSSSDDLETIESMLRSIGMAWAIPTLYKTQEALALASSSSSLELSKKSKNKGSGSELSLKDYLRKQILGEISSSTMLSCVTPGSFLGESSDVSGIPGAANSSGEKSKQRTSTPINVSKSTNKSKAVFSDSDLSSIKPESSKTKRKS